MKKHQSARVGFTLLELLVVVAIIGILAALLFPVFGRIQERGREVRCTNNLRQLHTAAMSYNTDQGRLPYSADFIYFENRDGTLVEANRGYGWVASYPDGYGVSWWYEENGSDNGTFCITNGALFEYLGDEGDEAVYVCPTMLRRAKELYPAGDERRDIVRSYGMNRAVSGLNIDDVEGPSRSILFADQGFEQAAGMQPGPRLISGEGPEYNDPYGNRWYSTWADGSIDHTLGEFIGEYHGRRARTDEGMANVIFVDGHVERVRYIYTDYVCAGDWEYGAPVGGP